MTHRGDAEAAGAISGDPRPWAPRAELMPDVVRTPHGTLRAESNGSPGCYGGWEIPIELDDGLAHPVVSVRVRWGDLQRGAASTEALALWVDADGTSRSWAPLELDNRDGGWLTLRSRPLDRPAGCRLVLRVQVRWTPTGWAEWTGWAIEEIEPPTPSSLRLAAGSSPAASLPTSLSENRDRFLALCRRAGDAGVDLLCLPETILSQDLGEPAGQGLVEQAVEIPGEHIQPFATIAEDAGMAIAFSVLERTGDLVFNTAVVIDSHGRIILRYRKVHLAIREAWRGVTPGDEFAVASLESIGARVGVNICMDSSSVESARAVARAGADILLLPIENDFRATAWERTAEASAPFSLSRWSLIQRARAIDNHLYVVAARNAGVGSGIFGPDGSVLAMDDGDSPLVMADVDLHDLRRHPTGPPYRDVIWYQRRPDVYGDPS